MKDFFAFSKEHRPALEKALTQNIDYLCDKVLHESHDVSIFWQQNIKKELTDYVLRGKMIRGMLTMYCASWYGVSTHSDSALASLGSTLELLQAFLLIHDDIMDKDRMRRGTPSMHVRLQNITECAFSNLSTERKKRKDDFSDLGEALALCLGDIVFSHTICVLNDAMPLSHLKTAIHIFSTYVSKVGLAQINDMYWESNIQQPTQEDILAMYKGKTGHYTFTLPFLMGYLYACGVNGQDIEQAKINNFENIGSTMGMLFQIQDDVLDIKEATNVTGKQRGSDIVKKKHTYFRGELFSSAQKNGQYEKLQELWDSTISEKELDVISQWAEEWGVYATLEEKCRILLGQIQVYINNDNVEPKVKQAMNHFVQYIVQRTF